MHKNNNLIHKHSHPQFMCNGKCTTRNQLQTNHSCYFTMGNQMCNEQSISIYKNSNLNHRHSHAQTMGKWEMHNSQPIKNQSFILFHHGKSNVQWAIHKYI